MKYLKSLLYIIIPLIILSLISSFMYYLNWINTSIYEWLELLVPLISFFIGGLYLGKNSKQKGWLEGLKLGSGMIILLFIISYLAFDIGISLKNIVYYLIVLFANTFGSMVGIRNVDKELM